MKDNNKECVERIEDEVSWWKIAAWTSPFVAMSGLLLCIIFADEYINFAISAIILSWVAVSVAWWWWAIHRILEIARLLVTTTANFDDVKKEITELKNDVGNRKRSKQN